MSKDTLVKSALEEFDDVFHPSIFRLGVEKVNISFGDYKIAKDFLTKQITLAYEEGKREGREA